MKKTDDTIQELVNDEYEANDVIVDAGIKDETDENDSEEAGDNELKNYDQKANCELVDNGKKQIRPMMEKSDTVVIMLAMKRLLIMM